MKYYFFIVPIIFILALSFPVCAEYRTGLAAYRLHHYKWAIRELMSDQSRDSQYLLGVMFFKGEGVKADRLAGIEWFRKASAQGHAQALFELGSIYFEGKEVAIDHVEAAKWFHKAADQGHLQAQFIMGQLYINGDGVEKNRNLAVLWLKKASFCGYRDAGRLLKALGEEVPPRAQLTESKVTKRPLTPGAPSVVPSNRPL